MKRLVPDIYNNYLRGRAENIFSGEETNLRPRCFYIGISLSFFLAIGAPYANMIIRGSYMARDFTTHGAIGIFLLLVGPINALLKWSRTPLRALILFLNIYMFIVIRYIIDSNLDMYSPGLIFTTFFSLLVLSNLLSVLFGKASLFLNRAELILVYIMLLIVSALCTMGFSEQFLPMITAIFYFATPENKWQERLFPFQQQNKILVNDGDGNKGFYEGLTPPDTIPWSSWTEPLILWGIFFLAYTCVWFALQLFLGASGPNVNA